MRKGRRDPRQLELFAPPERAPSPAAAPRADVDAIGPAPLAPEIATLAARLPRGIRLGTSSWSFPGWRGLVYDRTATETQLARHGLAAYARHPLLRMVGIDRTFYAPLTRADFARYAADVPDDFRFLCKAYDGLTAPTRFERSPAGANQRRPSVHFLDAAFAADVVVAPFVEGLGARAGPLVFQFVPLARRTLGDPGRFIERLHAFLAALPRGPLYAVELRNRELLNADYRAALAAAGACHCYNVHPTMPPVAEQAAALPPDAGPAVVVRWMLHSGADYETARAAYRPFDRLVDEDLASRAAIAELCGAAVVCGRPAFVAANNKAEGSAPLTVLRLAERIVGANTATG